MPPGSEEEPLHQLLAQHGFPPVLRYVGAISSSVTVAGVTMAAARDPAASTLAWMLAMLSLNALIWYLYLDRYLRHVERLAEVYTASNSGANRKRDKRRTKKRRTKKGQTKKRGGAAGS